MRPYARTTFPARPLRSSPFARLRLSSPLPALLPGVLLAASAFGLAPGHAAPAPAYAASMPGHAAPAPAHAALIPPSGTNPSSQEAGAVGAATSQEATATLRGRVTLGDVGIGSAIVTLHEVSLGGGSEIDSVLVTDDGSFAFELPRVPDPESGTVFFASTLYEDILYFGIPVNRVVQLDSTYLIRVYETAPAPPGGADLPVSVRNLFLQDMGTGWSVVDLIQIRNDGFRTLIPADGDAVWSYPLLGGAQDFEVGESDLAEDAVRFADGRMYIAAPVPPGERLYAVRYSVPGHQFVAPLPGRTETIELLVREPAPPTTVTGLQPLPPVEVEEGVTYRRYAGGDMVDDAVGLLMAEERKALPLEWMAVILSLILAWLALYAVYRDPRRATASAADERRKLLREVAILDEAHAREGKLGSKARKAYRRRRNRLLARLELSDDRGG